MGSLLGFLATLFSKIETNKLAELGYKSTIETLKFAAWKSILVFVLFTGSLISVSIILQFVFSSVYTYVDSQMANATIDGSVSFGIQVTDFFAFLVEQLRVDDALRILVSALTTKFVFKFIPFIKF